MGFRETPEVVDAIVRLVGAVGKRVAEEDPTSLAELRRLDAAVATAWSVAIGGLRASGESDSEIGDVLGVTKQAVAQRWPH